MERIVRQWEAEVFCVQRVSMRVRTSMCSCWSHHRTSVSFAGVRPLMLREETVRLGGVVVDMPWKERKCPPTERVSIVEE